MWVVQEFPDSWRVLRTHENGKALAEAVEVKRFERTSLGKSQANTFLTGLIERRTLVEEVLVG